LGRLPFVLAGATVAFVLAGTSEVLVGGELGTVVSFKGGFEFEAFEFSGTWDVLLEVGGTLGCGPVVVGT
jgi:hypothetical protein